MTASQSVLPFFTNWSKSQVPFTHLGSLNLFGTSNFASWVATVPGETKYCGAFSSAFFSAACPFTSNFSSNEAETVEVEVEGLMPDFIGWKERRMDLLGMRKREDLVKGLVEKEREEGI